MPAYGIILENDKILVKDFVNVIWLRIILSNFHKSISELSLLLYKILEKEMYQLTSKTGAIYVTRIGIG